MAAQDTIISRGVGALAVLAAVGVLFLVLSAAEPFPVGGTFERAVSESASNSEPASV